MTSQQVELLVDTLRNEIKSLSGSTTLSALLAIERRFNTLRDQYRHGEIQLTPTQLDELKSLRHSMNVHYMSIHGDMVDRLVELQHMVKVIDEEQRMWKDALVKLAHLGHRRLAGTMGTTSFRRVATADVPKIGTPTRRILEQTLRGIGKLDDVSVISSTRLAKLITTSNIDASLKEQIVGLAPVSFTLRATTRKSRIPRNPRRATVSAPKTGLSLKQAEEIFEHWVDTMNWWAEEELGIYNEDAVEYLCAEYQPEEQQLSDFESPQEYEEYIYSKSDDLLSVLDEDNDQACDPPIGREDSTPLDWDDPGDWEPFRPGS